MKTNKSSEFELLQQETDTVEIPVNMGKIKFVIDVLYAELVRDVRSNNAETLEVQLEIRGTDSRGNDLVMHRTVSLIAS